MTKEQVTEVFNGHEVVSYSYQQWYEWVHEQMIDNMIDEMRLRKRESEDCCKDVAN